MNFSLIQQLNNVNYNLHFVISNFTPIQNGRKTEYLDVQLDLVSIETTDGIRISLSEFNQELEKLKKKEQKLMMLEWETKAIKLLEK